MTDAWPAAAVWQDRIDELLARLGVPGAAVGVSHQGRRLVLTSGVQSLRSGHPVIPQTAFQLGSISKLYTTSVLAALTGLDAQLLKTPVRELLREATWIDPQITIGHLLTHSSGLGGDYFPDTGRGDDCLQRYVQQLAALPRDFPQAPGCRYSYCNSGFAVLGRLVEVLSGLSFDAALQQHLLGPVGVQATTVLPEQTLLFPHAMGHSHAGGGPLSADNVWHFARAADPIGGVCAPAAEVLAFAEMHIADGLAADGTRVLPPGVAQAMRERVVSTAPGWSPAYRGLGWEIHPRGGGDVVGHDGETVGQISRLRVIPDRKLALVVLTNGNPDGNVVIRELEALILGEFEAAPAPLAPAARVRIDPGRYTGTYVNVEGVVRVAATDYGLRAVRVEAADGLFGQEYVTELVAIGEDRFVDRSDPQPLSAFSFADPDPADGGRFGSFFYGRVACRQP